MIKVATVEKIRQIEAVTDATIFSYATMMENAGRALAMRILDVLKGKASAQVLVLVGSGNNGGDGLVAGRIIAQTSSAQVHFYLVSRRAEDDINYQAVLEAELSITLAEHDWDKRILHRLATKADIIVDAIYGIGVRLPLSKHVSEILVTIRQSLQESSVRSDDAVAIQSITPMIDPETYLSHRPYIIAVDCPSGVNCDDGCMDPNTLIANETVSFIAGKPGLFEYPAATSTGIISVAPIGIPAHLPELASIKWAAANIDTVGRLLPVRPPNSNKGTFGKVLIVAGSKNYIGAAGLTAISAYRSGCGLVTVSATKGNIGALSGQLLEPTWLCLPDENGFISRDAISILDDVIGDYDSIVIGPGIGNNKATRDFISTLFSRGISFPPVVLDADALNLLSTFDDWWRMLPNDTVITPHPGEMSRLSRMTIKEVLSDRWSLASAKATEWKVVLVLKGSNSLVSAPDGSVTVIPVSTDALATAGTGDVLSGMIGGLLAQKLPPYSAAIVGSFVHGMAGLYAQSELGGSRGVIASDVLRAIPRTFGVVEMAGNNMFP